MGKHTTMKCAVYISLALVCVAMAISMNQGEEMTKNEVSEDKVKPLNVMDQYNPLSDSKDDALKEMDLNMDDALNLVQVDGGEEDMEDMAKSIRARRRRRDLAVRGAGSKGEYPPPGWNSNRV